MLVLAGQKSEKIFCYINNNLILFYLRSAKNYDMIFQLYYKKKKKIFAISINS